MKEILTEIQSGQFAKEWRSEFENGMSNYKSLLEKDLSHEIESTGREIRQHFSWLNEKKQGTAS